LKDRIKLRLKALDLSPRAASLKAGMGPDLLRDLLSKTGRQKRLTTESLPKVAAALETSSRYLLGETDDPGIEIADQLGPRRVPFRDSRGFQEMSERPVWRDEPLGSQTFALLVPDDAMVSASPAERGVHAGDVVIADPQKLPQPACLVVANVEEGRVLRQYHVRRDPSGDTYIVLKALNGAWPEIRVRDSNEIEGTVIETITRPRPRAFG
jgi:SOS-response transcriptional repressor LexA